MTIDVEQDITVTVRGQVGESAKSYARQRVAQACAHVAEPVLFAEVKLTHEPHPAQQLPFVAEAALTLSGTTLRVHVAADSMGGAIDLLDDRLRRRIDRYTSMRSDHHKNGSQSRARAQVDVERALRDERGARPERRSRPVDERELVRHKTFAVGELSPDEAADLLDLLNHDFLLFTNVVSGADAVLWNAGADGLELLDAGGEPAAIGDDIVTPMRHNAAAVRRCTTAEAIEELDLDLEPFVFFVDPDVGRGQVAYHRYDGHYGLISPA